MLFYDFYDFYHVVMPWHAILTGILSFGSLRIIAEHNYK